MASPKSDFIWCKMLCQITANSFCIMYDVVFVQCVTSVDTEMEVSICLLIDVQSGAGGGRCKVAGAHSEPEVVVK